MIFVVAISKHKIINVVLFLLIRPMLAHGAISPSTGITAPRLVELKLFGGFFQGSLTLWTYQWRPKTFAAMPGFFQIWKDVKHGLTYLIGFPRSIYQENWNMLNIFLDTALWKQRSPSQNQTVNMSAPWVISVPFFTLCDLFEVEECKEKEKLPPQPFPEK